jgi:hypothetical protein
MKHFLKVLFSTQSHSPQSLGAVEKLELPNNRKGFEREEVRVFRLFELFDRGDCVSGYTLAANTSGGKGRGGIESLEAQ